jgi:hypothetical protein
MQLGESSVNGDIKKMKSIIGAIILLAVATIAPAADNDQKKADPNPKGVTIPKDAVPNPDGKTYSYTDKQGKKWTYAKTPFGVMKIAAKDKPGDAPRDLSSTKAFDKGDTVRFERPSPFGMVIWEKNKSELTDDERHILDTQNAKTEQK